MFAKFLLVALLALFLSGIACSDIGIGGKCHHKETGKVLTEVEDANGVLFPRKENAGPAGFIGYVRRLWVYPLRPQLSREGLCFGSMSTTRTRVSG